MTKVFKARSHAYAKSTRALLKHLRDNGHQMDKRADRLWDQRVQALNRLSDLVSRTTNKQLEMQIRQLFLGSLGINDQIAAMLTE